MNIPTIKLSMFSFACSIEIRQVRTSTTCGYACFDTTNGGEVDMECSGHITFSSSLDALMQRYNPSDFDEDLASLVERAKSFDAQHGMDWLVADDDLVAWMNYADQVAA